MYSHFRRLSVAFAATLLAVSISPLRAEETCQWSRVAVGGGGWFTGILYHPQSKTSDPVLYCRGDLAGIHRWDAPHQRWINLGDSLPTSSQYLRGCDGMAVDPSETSATTVYAVFGQYEDNHNYMIDDTMASLQGLYKSADRGAHWTQVAARRAGSNEDSRWSGEPVAVDPESGGKVVFYGTRHEGLAISTNATAALTAITFETEDPNSPDHIPAGKQGRGIRCVIFDPRTTPDNTLTIDGITRTKNAYAGLPMTGVWATHDGGVTWAKLPAENAPDNGDIKRMVVLKDGSLVVAHDHGLAKFSNNTWTDIVPSGLGSTNAVTLNPKNPEEMIIAGGGGSAGGYSSAIYFTSQASTVTPTSGWNSRKFNDNSAKRVATAGWGDWTALCSTDCLTINPNNPGEVWETDVYGAWTTKDITAKPAIWTSVPRDLEIGVAVALDSPSAGPTKLLAGFGDIRGFRWTDLNAFPKAWLIQPEGTCIYGITSSAGNSRYVAKVGANSPWEGFSGPSYWYSADGGSNWSKGSLPAVEKLGNAELALSSDRDGTPKAVLFVNTWGGGMYTCDNAFSSSMTAESWTRATTDFKMPDTPGAWTIATLQADKKKPGNFYFGCTPEDGQKSLWVSSDFGHSWTIPPTQASPAAGFDALPSSKIHPWAGTLAVSPVDAGDVWFGIGPAGLYHSADGGKNFKKIATVSSVRAVAAGLPRSPGGHCALYLLGQINIPSNNKDNDSKPLWGLFLSEDSGKSWTKLTTDSFQIPGGDYEAQIIADGQTFGRFYVADGNTGIITGTVKGAAK